jgi:hypothetical protein
MSYIDRRAPRLFACIIAIIALFLSYIDLVEFYSVGVIGHIAGYPWGNVNDAPWYYQTPQIYSQYNLGSGLCFLTTGLLTTVAIIKRYKVLVLVGICLIVLLLIVDMVSGGTT